MNREAIEIIETIAKQRKIEKQVIIGDLEQAMVSAARKHFNSLDTEEFSCNMDLLTGEICIWRHLDEGGCIGLMGEIATVAAKHGANVVGVITHKLVAHEQANEKCNELIVVDTMQERRTLMMERSDAFIVLPGGIGTYEEFFEVLVGRQLSDHAKPIGIVNVDGYFDPLITMLEHGINRNFMRPALRQLMFIDSCPNAVLDYISSGNNSQPSPEDILPMHG